MARRASARVVHALVPISDSLAGHAIPGLAHDVDATIVVCHSEKASTAKTWK